MDEHVKTLDFSTNIAESIKLYATETFNRQFPDYRDGIKHIHRRILWVMHKNGWIHNTKVATIVGAVMKFHPHGDLSISDTLVRLGQSFNMNYPYIDGQGNWGSQSGDEAAAGRYIEARLSQFARDVITSDLDEVVVPYTDSYDYKDRLPVYLPTKVPLVLVNGIEGIGEGFITNIPSHNLKDVVEKCITFIEDREITNEALVEGFYPDFPTGGIITNGRALSQMYKGGEKATLRLKAKITIDQEQNLINVQDLPYGKDFDTICTQVLEEQKKGNIVLQGIFSMQEINNNRHHDRTTYDITCKKDANLIEISRELFSKTNLEISRPVSFMLNFDDSVKLVTVRDIIENWYHERVNQKTKRLSNEIAKAQNKKHVLEGFTHIYPKLDELIATIKGHEGTKDALVSKLSKKFSLTIVQSDAICNMSLHEISKTAKADNSGKIASLDAAIASNEHKLLDIDGVIIEELREIGDRHGRERETEIRLDGEEAATQAITVSQGAAMAGRLSLGLFDANGVLSRSILNGLKSVKIDGRNVREIVNAVALRGATPVGFALFYADGTGNVFPISGIRVLNTWHDLGLQNTTLTSMTPFYEGDTHVVSVSNDNKIKMFPIESLTKRQADVGGVIVSATSIAESSGSTILIASSKGNYTNLTLDEIPSLSRGAGGVKLSFDKDEAPFVLAFKKEDGLSVLVGSLDTRDRQGYILTVPTNDIPTFKRSNRPKRFPLPGDYVLSGLGLCDVTDRESQVITMGPVATTGLKTNNFKKPFQFKRLFMAPIGFTQLH
jgi:DNA gyrase/topoisomerase IV subunit A